MSPTPQPAAEARRFPRLALPAMYTFLRARLSDDDETNYPWAGHIYDISHSGMRFEIDHALPSGIEITVRAMLPGPDQTTITATGRVVRIHDDDDLPGPIRMGMTFDRFENAWDRRRLEDYLAGRGLRQAA